MYKNIKRETSIEQERDSQNRGFGSSALVELEILAT